MKNGEVFLAERGLKSKFVEPVNDLEENKVEETEAEAVEEVPEKPEATGKAPGPGRGRKKKA
jgi:hypothetical protein